MMKFLHSSRWHHDWLRHLWGKEEGRHNMEFLVCRHRLFSLLFESFHMVPNPGHAEARKINCP